MGFLLLVGMFASLAFAYWGRRIAKRSWQAEPRSPAGVFGGSLMVILGALAFSAGVFVLQNYDALFG